MSQTEHMVSDASDLLTKQNISVLIIDTCALLDVVRIPVRIDSHTRAERILESVSCILSMRKHNPPQLSIVIPPLIPSEWEENHGKTSQEVKRHLKKLDSMIRVANVSAGSFNKVQPLVTFSNLKLHEELLKLSKKILYAGTWLKSENIIQQIATDRAVSYTPPARKGAIKDCIIYEHSLELFRLLRANRFSKKCVFFTSNTKDFCDETGSCPQEPIKTELNNVSAHLTTNWEWTLHLLNEDQ